MTGKPINWVGFYLLDQDHAASSSTPRKDSLILGPFQGKVACTTIEFGRGVCGTAAQENRTLLVKDVHEFPGHIACDAASSSEIVIPLELDGVTKDTIYFSWICLGCAVGDDELTHFWSTFFFSFDAK